MLIACFTRDKKKGASKVVSNLEAGGTFLIPTEKQVIHALENRKRFLIANSESYGNKILFLVKSGRTNISKFECRHNRKVVL